LGLAAPSSAAVAVATILCLAVDREQAAIVLNYIKAYFEQVPALAALVKSIDRDGVTLRNRVAIVVGTNSYRSVRGRTILCAIFDEVAFWRDENSASPDIETHGAVQPGLGRIPGSMLILISTAHRRSGLLYAKWKDHYGRDDDHVLCVRALVLAARPTQDVVPFVVPFITGTPRRIPGSSPSGTDWRGYVNPDGSINVPRAPPGSSWSRREW
jgi:hypothetical protein